MTKLMFSKSLKYTPRTCVRKNFVEKLKSVHFGPAVVGMLLLYVLSEVFVSINAVVFQYLNLALKCSQYLTKYFIYVTTLPALI